MKNKKITTLLVGAFIGGLVLVPGVKHHSDKDIQKNQIKNNVLLASQGSWEKYGNDTWYYNIGNTAVKGWKNIDGSMYYFNNSGVKQIGWLENNGSIYYLGYNGVMQTGWREIFGQKYYFNNMGIQQRGWHNINGSRYYFNDSGIKQVGWQEINGLEYYMGYNGVMTTGWREIFGQKYYFNDQGKQQIGWQEVDGSWYYMGYYGIVETGWRNIFGSEYYFNNEGIQQRGWHNIDGSSYYFNNSGIKQIGWLENNGSIYYLGYNGIKQTGWREIFGQKYYFNNTGVQQTGLQEVDGDKYYFNSDGIVQTGWQSVNGTWYYFNANGQMKKSENNKVYTKDNYNITMDKYVAGEVKNYVAAVGKNNLTKEEMVELKGKIAKAINPKAAKDMYQFLNVGTYRNISVSELNQMLAGQGVFSGEGQAFINAAKEYNLDLVYFVAQSILETGWGKSSFAEGITITKTYKITDGKTVTLDKTLAKPVKVYNLFGIGAFDQAPTKGGTSYAYNHGWTTVPKAIAGAAKFLSQNYVHHNNLPQNTPYELRYINGDRKSVV